MSAHPDGSFCPHRTFLLFFSQPSLYFYVAVFLLGLPISDYEAFAAATRRSASSMTLSSRTRGTPPLSVSSWPAVVTMAVEAGAGVRAVLTGARLLARAVPTGARLLAPAQDPLVATSARLLAPALVRARALVAAPRATRVRSHARSHARSPAQCRQSRQRKRRRKRRRTRQRRRRTREVASTGTATIVHFYEGQNRGAKCSPHGIIGKPFRCGAV